MSVILKDLNDYISPSQACIKPVEVKKTSKDNNNVIKLDNSGEYYEVSQEGVETKLEPANISLEDCLACSGCITSAESILITMQSQEELYNVLKSNKQAKIDGKLEKIIVVSIAPQSRVSIATKYGLTPLKAAKRLTHFFKSLGVHYVFDTSFSQDFSLLESAREFVERYRKFNENRETSSFPENVSINNRVKRENTSKDTTQQKSTSSKDVTQQKSTSSKDATQHKSSCDICLPVLASSCPGWICYAEKTHEFILPYISKAKSPQQIMGSIVKDHLASKLGVEPNNIYHVGIMMCYDKKLEASRSDFFNEGCQTRDVDCVLTTGEVVKMFEEQNFNIDESLEVPIDSFVKASQEGQLLRSPGSASGGFLEFILEYSARELFGITGIDVEKEQGVTIKTGRNKDFKEISLEVDGKPLLKFASAYGFRNIQNLVRKIKSGNSPYHYIEVMACPSGCINGGGQLKPSETIPIKDWISKVNNMYLSVDSLSPEKNEAVLNLYSEWLGGKDNPKCKKMLHTQYHAVKAITNPLTVKW
ncbi:10980_t:CDS:2 [Cetraspora pellucida]|uniref:10980_t:CDS:1 n=1 Tax=Cetraspora pellucida TaxID=1433469 RepID=A0ACA9M252_9GLOM|nr:10980_t:CDS:2 [Cetraspora pellucida]